MVREHSYTGPLSAMYSSFWNLHTPAKYFFVSFTRHITCATNMARGRLPSAKSEIKARTTSAKTEHPGRRSQKKTTLIKVAVMRVTQIQMRGHIKNRAAKPVDNIARTRTARNRRGK